MPREQRMLEFHRFQPSSRLNIHRSAPASRGSFRSRNASFKHLAVFPAHCFHLSKATACDTLKAASSRVIEILILRICAWIQHFKLPALLMGI